jgi:Ni/Co efflux regulator RcnB
MRKFILIGLMTAMAMPGAALAAPHDNNRHRSVETRHDVRHDNRQEARRHNRGWTAYAAPVRNWRYRPVTVGYQLPQSFFGSRYYVSNYTAYQVRAPGRNQRWIRYGDDLLLVNIRSGRVLQVLHNRYW